MAKKTVCISFDYEHDSQYRYLLSAWDANSDFAFVFNDKTPLEIQSNDYSRIKAVLTTKISSAAYLLVIVGKYSNKRDYNWAKIGDWNWQTWEIKKAKELHKKIVAVKLDRSYDSPDELYNSNVSWAFSFGQDSIIKALNNA